MDGNERDNIEAGGKYQSVQEGPMHGVAKTHIAGTRELFSAID
jgi:hypothetical protein